MWANMEGADFEMPSPKRQRTNSPVDSRPSATIATTATASSASPSNEPQIPGLGDVMGKEVNTIPTNIPEHDMLDVLMQHVESESTARASASVMYQNNEVQEPDPERLPVPVPVALQEQSAAQHEIMDLEQEASKLKQAQPESAIEPTPQNETATTLPAQNADLPPGLQPVSDSAMNYLREEAAVDQLPPTAETLLAAHIPATTTTPAPEDGPKEWETDSSFDSDSSSDISSSDSDEDEEYTLLDPYEQARILMAEDGGAGSDDEGTRQRAAAASASVRTQNEATEDILPKPNIIVTPEMAIEELGHVEAVVENVVLIKAKTTGAYQVLESGSVLCLADRFVVGAVAETLGRVEEPLYTVRYPSAADIEENKVSDKGTKIFYVKDHSTFVFTQPLKAVKGSDASNLHDEEVGDEEMEFSDDEAEAEYKRNLKMKRKGIDPATRGRGRGRGAGIGGRAGGSHMSSIPESYSDNVEMNYDEVEEGETDYTPLRRPDMNQMAPPMQSRGRGRGRGRDRGRGRGRDHRDQRQHYNQTAPYQQQPPQQHTLQQQLFLPGQSAYAGFPPPPPPQLAAQGYTSFMPSPITPLPGGNYNFDFAAAAASQWQQYHQNQNAQYQQQQPFTGQVNADAIAQVARQLEELRRQSQNGGQ